MNPIMAVTKIFVKEITVSFLTIEAEKLLVQIGRASCRERVYREV